MAPAKTHTVTAQLEASLKSASWLLAADGAAIQVARRLASALDSASDPREIVALAKQLNDVLQSLGMNVAGRTGKAEAPKKEVNPLDEIKAKAQIRQPLPKTAHAKPKPAKPSRSGNRAS